MPPVASRRMYRHSATMHSHSTPVERVDHGKGIAKREGEREKTLCYGSGGERGWVNDGGGVGMGSEKEMRDGGGELKKEYG